MISHTLVVSMDAGATRNSPCSLYQAGSICPNGNGCYHYHSMIITGYRSLPQRNLNLKVQRMGIRPVIPLPQERGVQEETENITSSLTADRMAALQVERKLVA